ncbi:hypothetical protein [cf. Phormidesmis sp. LEGE 11477]|uniref:hypothetical protein n=1 Tax=cf. Phormidesmis sp. LEGE 11477 TaxID=1828680 RepID=UPI001881CE44|nr:hypothetical protein [cf. Phormidesmis sp. LEGE 11477]MBE9062109.1 hypothetical protein [cf. Phormidesmis sp. LEGE 11477]
MTDPANQTPSGLPGAELQENTLPAQISTLDDRLSDRQMVVFSAAAGGLLSFVSVALSVEMTQTAIADLSPVAVGTAISLPFIFGLLGFKFKQPFLDALSATMNSLPF